MKKVTAVFDIGKTNKKFFLFDEEYQEVYRDYKRFEEIEDEDGFPTDNLQAIQIWAKTIFEEILKSKKYDVATINFSTYGASLVHIDKNGHPLTPLYNYTKPIDEECKIKFYNKYGGRDALSTETASPPAGMLSSGLQLFWLKETKPEIYRNIKYSLHFPQYMSYLFTGIPVSDYTSIGCHTALWDYTKNDYHDWVYAEGIDEKLAPIVESNMSINMQYLGKKIKVGVGIHDSSAALLPYLKGDRNEFLLISTGTWSITLNPFSDGTLSHSELTANCLNYMRPDGHPVKASRLFLGNEYKIQIDNLHKHFGKDYGYHKTIKFSEEIYHEVSLDTRPRFHFASLDVTRAQPDKADFEIFPNFEYGYHKLMLELMELQVHSARSAVGDTNIRKVYIDGGFTDNDLFVKLVSFHFRNHKVRTGKSPLGSALGAAMVIADKEIHKKFLKKMYGLKKHKPLILSSQTTYANED